MGNYNNDIFEFGVESNEELEQTNDFNYASISGLGESDYQNEDLFNTEVEDSQSLNNDYRIGSLDNVGDIFSDNLEENKFEIQEPVTFEEETISSNIPLESTVEEESDNKQNLTDDVFSISIDPVNEFLVEDNEKSEQMMGDAFNIPMTTDNEILEQEDNDVAQDLMGNVFNASQDLVSNTSKQETLTIDEFDLNNNVYEFNPEPINEEITKDVVQSNEVSEYAELVEQPTSETQEELEENQEIIVSETPIEELNELTHFEEEKIEETDINNLFDRVSVNVKEASDIFRKNTDLKKKIDTRFEELKKLQSEIENSRKKQIDEINSYKEEVLNKLTEKKEEIEKRLNLLKESQAALEKEKQEFEQYRKEEKENIEKVQKEVQAAYDDRREELGHIEDVLRKQKDSLDEERSQLSLDRIEYEADKNELANNLLKFDELVNSFTNGISDVKE